MSEALRIATGTQFWNPQHFVVRKAQVKKEPAPVHEKVTLPYKNALVLVVVSVLHRFRR